MTWRPISSTRLLSLSPCRWSFCSPEAISIMRKICITCPPVMFSIPRSGSLHQAELMGREGKNSPALMCALTFSTLGIKLKMVGSANVEWSEKTNDGYRTYSNSEQYFVHKANLFGQGKFLFPSTLLGKRPYKEGRGRFYRRQVRVECRRARLRVLRPVADRLPVLLRGTPRERPLLREGDGGCSGQVGRLLSADVQRERSRGSQRHGRGGRESGEGEVQVHLLLVLRVRAHRGPLLAGAPGLRPGREPPLLRRDHQPEQCRKH